MYKNEASERNVKARHEKRREEESLTEKKNQNRMTDEWNGKH